MKVRKWYVDKALHSVRSMMEVINHLTPAEITAALDIESASRRRVQVTQRLIGRAVKINELQFTTTLMEKYYHASK